ncbi:MAG: hypothetical protein QOE54_3802 [Streptosporangiaceae bacterium]|nr:hypothetical protein [Streptosporangiaceae bacterium]
MTPQASAAGVCGLQNTSWTRLRSPAARIPGHARRLSRKDRDMPPVVAPDARGSSHSYRIRVTDPLGNVVTSAPSKPIKVG